MITRSGHVLRRRPDVFAAVIERGSLTRLDVTSIHKDVCPPRSRAERKWLGVAHGQSTPQSLSFSCDFPFLSISPSYFLNFNPKAKLVRLHGPFVSIPVGLWQGDRETDRLEPAWGLECIKGRQVEEV